MIQLWPFQQSCIDALRVAFRSHRSVLLQSPCGSGKTTMFSFLAHSHIQRKENAHVLILVHRQELVDQVVHALGKEDIRPDILDGTHHARYSNGRVTVGSVFTVVRRLDRIRPPTLLIIDEAHHAAVGTTWGKVAAHFHSVPTLGTSATPCRLDGAGLGSTFDTLVCGPSTAQLIRDGYLAPLRVFAPPTVNTTALHRRFGEFMRGELIELMDKPTITGDVIEHYQWYGAGARAVVFCVSVEHAYSVAEAFRRAGYGAFELDGGLDADVRAERVAAFRSGRVQILTACDLISEGFDVPDIEVGISLRPTHSMGLWFQQVGRCLRRCEGKEHAIILDHAGNSVRHGLPTDTITWSLDNGVAAKLPPGAGIKLCEHCFATNPAHARECCECHKPFKTKPRVVASVKGELVQMSMEDYQVLQAKRGARRAVGIAKSLDALRQIEKQRGYRRGWADHVWAAKQARGA